jgi:hypothetical protein
MDSFKVEYRVRNGSQVHSEKFETLAEAQTAAKGMRDEAACLAAAGLPVTYRDVRVLAVTVTEVAPVADVTEDAERFETV